MAWVINIPACTSPGHKSWNASECFLKSGAATPHKIANKCRISGSLGTTEAADTEAAQTNICSLHALIPPPPVLHGNGTACGHWATKLMLNNEPAPFLAGILSQGFWPVCERAPSFASPRLISCRDSLIMMAWLRSASRPDCGP